MIRFGCVGFSMYAYGFSVPQMRSESALDSQLASAPGPIELCMASYQGLCAIFVSMMSTKCSIQCKRAGLHASSEMMIFLTKSASSINRSQAHLPALFKHIHNHIRSSEG